MIKNIKWIITDLDGTLLRSDGMISPETADCLNECRSRGLGIGFATARPEVRVLPITEQFKPDLTIFCGGAAARLHGKLLWELPVPEGTQEALSALRSQTDTAEYILADGLDFRYTDSAELIGSIPCASFFNFADPIEAPVLSFLVLLRESFDETDLRACLSPVSITPMLTPGLYRVAHPQATKEAAIGRFAENSGVGRDEILFFGDDRMDAGALGEFVGVAMGNAADEIKKCSRFVTDSCNDDGVARFLKKYVL